jgi:hypothetical protein
MTDPTFGESADDELHGADITLEEVAGLQDMELGGGEPTQVGEQEDGRYGDEEDPGAAARPILPRVPIIPRVPVVPRIPVIPVRKRAVSGRYLGTTGAFRLELRVDVDGTRPIRRVSGDFFQIVGRTVKYFGSFVVNAPAITVAATEVTIKGLGTYTFAAGAPVVQVKIARRSILQNQAPAVVQFFSTGGAPGAVYTCAFVSVYFRSVRIETDRVSDVVTPVFNSYNTGSLPSGGPARTLSVVRAYAEAGIQMIPTTGSNLVNVGEAGGNVQWSNAELHASMQRHFTQWRDLEQWAVWQLVAQRHDLGNGLYGIMFDQQGKQRQGCAVFHAGIGGVTPDMLRLYTYVHELGHCFNLLHSWQKQYATPPVPNRPDSLSWMNYPWNYPGGGAATFWSRFPFQFDNQEVIHLRHAFLRNIIMGGNNFAIGSGLGAEAMADAVEDQSGLQLEISTHQPSFALGEPVVLQLALRTTDSAGRTVHTWLHPNCGMVKIVIRKPSGEVLGYEPLIDHLVGARERMLGQGQSEKESAYIGYGRDGFYFDSPGHYLVRAAYAALDGSEVLSNVIRLRVRYPVTANDESLADLFMGEDQGTLLYLLGSDDESLKSGNAAFDEVLDKHAKHPMAQYARLVKGVNASRDFKIVSSANEDGVEIRPAKLDESARMLSAVADSRVLDPVSTRMTVANLAAVQTRSGDEAGARKSQAAMAAISAEIA